MDLATGTVVDRYTVQSVLGEGGMAVVYLCRHNQLGTLHALKVLTMSSRAIRERLVQEGRVQASLRHRNIVAVTDIVMLNGAPGLIMEYIQGPSLDDLLAQQALSYEQVDALAEGVLQGVAHAHAQGLVHRDLKPANVMLALEGSMLVPKVTDFGLAKLLEGAEGRAATRTGSTMGTPHYMSPEQVADSKNVDHRTDVFALGAILYEMACGRRAFGGENLLQIFSAVADARYTPPRDVKPDLPERMERAILGALEPDKEKRIQTVEALMSVWSGQTAHAAGTVPVAPTGPFGAAFVESLRASSLDKAPSVPSQATWDGAGMDVGAVSVESLHRGPEQAQPLPSGASMVPPVVQQVRVMPPPPAAAPAHQVPAVPPPQVPAPEEPPRSSGGTSLLSGLSLALGGGAAAVLIGTAVVVLGIVVTVGGLAIAVGFGTDPKAEDPVQPEPHEDPILVEPEPVEPQPDEPSPTSRPTPTPTPAGIAPSPVPSQPVPSPTPVGEPTPVPEPAPSEPEPVEPVPEPVPDPAPTTSVVMSGDLTSSNPSARISAIDALEDQPGASATLVQVARTDKDEAVRARAWNAIIRRYKFGKGDRSIEEPLIIDAMNTQVFSRREACDAYGFAGRDLDLIIKTYDAANGVEKVTIAGDIAKVARRADRRDEARALLEARKESAGANFVLKKALTKAIESL